MLSRVADSLFWMSRYMERCDGILRMLKTNYTYSQDDGTDFSWKPVLKIFSSSSEEEHISIERNSRSVLEHLVINKNNQNSVYNIISFARENARAIQDNVTKELWQCLNEYYHFIREKNVDNSLKYDDPISVLDDLIKQGLFYYGSSEITMPRNEGYCFMNLGKFLERAIQSVDTLDIKLNELNYRIEDNIDPSYWKYLLLSTSGYELHLKSYTSTFEPENVIDQIIWNKDFPRSILYAIKRLNIAYEKIQSERNDEGYKKISFMIGKLESNLNYSNLSDLKETGLKNYLSNIKRDLLSIGNALNHYYFAFN